MILPIVPKPPLVRNGIVIDSYLDIAVNKVCTLLSRPPESKDFFDLYFILSSSDYELEYLIRRAREKEAAFDNEEGILAFATNLLAVREFQLLPRMIKKLRLEDLKSFFILCILKFIFQAVEDVLGCSG